MSPEDAYSLLEAIATISGSKARLKKIKVSPVKKQKVRRPPVDFTKCNIPIGAELVFIEDPNIVATVVDGGKCKMYFKNFGEFYDDQIKQANTIVVSKTDKLSDEKVLAAVELIKSLMSTFTGKVGFIRPTFDEYPNRYIRERSVDYIPENKDYLYSADDIMTFFNDKDIEALVIVNPDNPTGNYIDKKNIVRLIEWAKNKGIKLVIDESFVDFTDEEDPSLIKNSILESNPHLFVMKSISKSYGVPGLRLGVLASGDTKTVDYIKKDVAIWNINSFAEFYMQIEEKYKKDYQAGLKKIREERVRFQGELSKVPHIRVIPSQANYVMVELDGTISPKELLKTLLMKYELLIKELTTKTNGKNYLRLAIRNTEDNDKLIAALKKELS